MISLFICTYCQPFSRYIEFVLQLPAYLPIYPQRELRKGIRRIFDHPFPRQPFTPIDQCKRYLALFLSCYDRTPYFIVNVPWLMYLIPIELSRKEDCRSRNFHSSQRKKQQCISKRLLYAHALLRKGSFFRDSLLCCWFLCAYFFLPILFVFFETDFFVFAFFLFALLVFLADDFLVLAFLLLLLVFLAVDFFLLTAFLLALLVFFAIDFLVLAFLLLLVF